MCPGAHGAGRHPFQPITSSPLSRRNIHSGADSGVPPGALGSHPIVAQPDFESSFTIVPGLMPGPLPGVVDHAGRHDTSALPGIRSVARCVELRGV